MTSRRFGMLLTLAASMTCFQANAATIFNINLTGAGEVPPVTTPATASSTVTLSTDQTMLTVNTSFTGLLAGVTGAHIHCCVLPGTNAPVVLNFIPAGFPTGVTSGTFNHTFTLATDLTGITATTFVASLLGGQTYENIHTTLNPGGEIRAQLPAVIPEPSTFVLMGAGVMALFLRRKSAGRQP